MVWAHAPVWTRAYAPERMVARIVTCGNHQRMIDHVARVTMRGMTTTRPANDAELSRMMFSAREYLDMYGDMMRTWGVDPTTGPHRIRDEIDAYRVSRGWNPDGFGGEAG